MSIHDEVNYRCAEGRLHRLSAGFLGAPERRTICVSTPLNAQLVGPWGDAAQAARWGRVRADLASFIDGDLIAVPKGERGGNSAYMRRLRPPRREVWEIRCREPRPSIRVFGRFAERDIFVALLWEERVLLGGPGDRAWRDAIVQCVTDWRNLFQPYLPVSGVYPDAYLSDAFTV